MRDFTLPLTKERKAFLKRRTETRSVMMRETGRAPSTAALDARMRADAQAEHKARLQDAGV